jgi:hypothetical protein
MDDSQTTHECPLCLGQAVSRSSRYHYRTVHQAERTVRWPDSPHDEEDRRTVRRDGTTGRFHCPRCADYASIDPDKLQVRTRSVFPPAPGVLPWRSAETLRRVPSRDRNRLAPERERRGGPASARARREHSTLSLPALRVQALESTKAAGKFPRAAHRRFFPSVTRLHLAPGALPYLRRRSGAHRRDRGG